MEFSFIEDEHKNMPLPPSRVNGGLYTGSQAAGNWGAVPVVPEAHFYLTQHLPRTGTPPPGAIQQPAAFMRPGNSYVKLPYHAYVSGFNYPFQR